MAVEAASAAVDPQGIGSTIAAASRAVLDARRVAAVGLALLAEAAVDYADARRSTDLDADRGSDRGTGLDGRRLPGHPQPGEFAVDELAPMLRQQPWHVRCLIARTRRVRSSLPTVWQAFRDGDLDLEQLIIIDRIARRATHADTLAALDETAVDAAATRSPKQLGTWLLRLIVTLEPDAFAARHRHALADRGVTVHQNPDGVGYLTGVMSADDAAAIDHLLTQAARSLGAHDPRSMQQRRADLHTDILLGRLRFTDNDDPDDTDDSAVQPDTGHRDTGHRAPASGSWIEVEDVDLDTGELRGTHWQWVDADGVPADHPADQPADHPADEPIEHPAGDPAGQRHQPLAVPTGAGGGEVFVRAPQTLRVGIVVPLSSLLGLTDTPAQLADRSSCLPADTIRDQIADLLTHADAASERRNRHGRRAQRARRGHVDEVLFTRLLTDDGGRLLEITELGRTASRRLAEAICIRAGTCRYPTCSVPAHLCDLDHHDPHPHGPTSGANQDPGCRRHHRGKTFAWIASCRDGDAVCWTLPGDHTYRVTDDPLPT